MSEKAKCKGRLPIPGMWTRERSCRRAATMASGYCKAHDPETRKAKNQDRLEKLRARWSAEDKAKAERERAERIGRSVLDGTAEAAIVDAISARLPALDCPAKTALSDAILAALRGEVTR